MNTLSSKIRTLREYRNYSQDYLAAELGVSQQTYSRLERKSLNISVHKLEQIAQLLDCDLVHLMRTPLRSFKQPFPGYENKLSTGRTEQVSTILNKLHYLEKEIASLKIDLTNYSSSSALNVT